ncbi:YlbL family protein [Georgenia sp. Z1344]|uniref:YlbL family protein n=1 Tax=Georgenia sp. Z1344 TaxID=3416706 RepID=UPI003CF04555
MPNPNHLYPSGDDAYAPSRADGPYAVGPDAHDGPDDAPGPLTARTLTLAISGGLSVLLLLVIMLVPLPYAVERPGPTVDTLGELDGHPLITVDGAETYPTSGELRLTTVSTVGGPGHPVTAGDVVRAWVLGSETVVPREAVFSPSETSEEIAQRGEAQMLSSQTNATVAALTELGYDIPMTLTVSAVAEESGAAGQIEVDDVITGIAAPGGQVEDVADYQQLVGTLGEVPPGETVQVRVERGGAEEVVEVVTTAPPVDASGAPVQEGSLLGVGILPDPDVPVDIAFDIDRIGGPSAGTMFALAIIDMLTEGEMTGGEEIAGTGTMDLAGRVGPIGGIRKKMVGAVDDGAEWFLAPAANCAETVGYVPDGLQVVRVTTLAEAQTAVEEIAAGRGDELPGCEAVGD